MATANKRSGIVIVNDCFGFGAQFNPKYAEWNDKTVTFWFSEDKRYSGSKHRRGTQTFAVATKELVLEAKAINDMQKAVNARARKFRERLQQLQAK